MHLDVSTLVVMGSFASACAGAVLLLAWWQNPKVPALGWWGLGNIVNALGILGLIVGPAAHLPLVSVASSALLTVAMGLIGRRPGRSITNGRRSASPCSAERW